MILLILLLYAIAAGTGYEAYCLGSVAVSAIHEIEGLLCQLMAIVALAGAIVCTGLAHMEERVLRQLRKMEPRGQTMEHTEAHL